MSDRIVSGVAAATLCTVLWIAPALARIEPGSTELDFYAGAYIPAPEMVDPSVAFGLRGGLNFSRKQMLQLGFGYMKTSGKQEVEGAEVDLDLTLGFIDGTYVYHILPRNRWVTNLFGGLSWGFADLTGDVQPSNPEEERFIEGVRADSFSLQGGFGGKWDMTRDGKWALTPNVRWRWFERRDEDPTDLEVTVAVTYTAQP